MITDYKMLKYIWYMVATAFPFFAASFLRLNIGPIHIAIPALILVAMVVIQFFRFAIIGTLRIKNVNLTRYKSLFALTIIFILVHFLGAFSSVDQELTMKVLMKLISSVIVFWGFIIFFPRDKEIMKTFLIIIFISSTFFISFLIYKYVFVFHSTFIGSNIGESQRSGKNQLSWYVAMVFPLLIAYFMKLKHKLVFILPIIIMIIALIFIGSRSAWMSISFGFIFIVSYLFKRNLKDALKIIITVLILGIVFVSLSFTIMSKYIDTTEPLIRLISIINPDSIDEEKANLGKYSYEHRGETLRQAFEAYLNHPIFGVGLTNTTQYVNRITHNDYMAILLELGIPGLAIFLLILVLSWKLGEGEKNVYYRTWMFLGRRGLMGALIFSLIFINIYPSIHYWLFLALTIVIGEIEKCAV